MILTILSFLFLLLILVLHVRGFSACRFKIEQQTPNGISVIIPFRNEAKNLTALLATLSVQKVAIPFEIILVNDNSIDEYAPIITSFLAQFQPNVLRLIHNSYDATKALSSKQQALDLGVSEATYELLVFTDADMEFEPNWLQSFINCYSEQSTPFLFGRTAVSERPAPFREQQFLQLEYLFAVAHLFAKTGIDSSCMGNNIAIAKSLYNDIGGQAGIGFTLVEDKKLLSAVKKRGISPTPVEPFHALAKTHAVDSPKVFLHQMIRWIRGGSTESWQITFIALLLFAECTAFLVVLFGAASPVQIGITVSGIIATWLLFLRQFHRNGIICQGVEFPLFAIQICIEILILLPAVLFIRPEWKGRHLRSPQK